MEHHLIKQLKAKQAIAWKHFFQEFSSSFTTIVKKYIKDSEHQRDVLQNSFVNMYRAIETFEMKGEGALQAWASKIVVNESLKFLRQQQKFQFAALPDYELPDESNEVDLESVSNQELIDAIQSLPEGYRIIFNLYVFENKSHKEIAEMLDISENTSASQFHRAKKWLAQKLEPLIQKNLAG